MKLSKLTLTLSAALLGSVMFTSNAQAEGRLVVYCSGTNLLCEAQTKAFGEKYDVKTSFIRNGSGSTLAKIEAEKNNPQADVWYGGTLDPQSQAGELGLLQPYRSPNVDQIVPRFQDPAKMKGNYSSAVYMGILGFGVNPERLAKLGIKEVPKCWKDLTDPRLKGEIQLPIRKVPARLIPLSPLLFNCGEKIKRLNISVNFIRISLNTPNPASRRHVMPLAAKAQSASVSYMIMH